MKTDRKAHPTTNFFLSVLSEAARLGLPETLEVYVNRDEGARYIAGWRAGVLGKATVVMPHIDHPALPHDIGHAVWDHRFGDDDTPGIIKEAFGEICRFTWGNPENDRGWRGAFGTGDDLYGRAQRIAEEVMPIGANALAYWWRAGPKIVSRDLMQFANLT